MKKLIIPTICLLLFSCEQSAENKIKNTIREYLSKSLNNIDSYEPVGYGKIDSVYTDISDLAIGSAKMSYHDSENYFISNNTKSRSKNNKLQGFMVTHIYRSKNNIGVKTLIKSTFFLNKDLSEVEFAKHDY